MLTSSILTHRAAELHQRDLRGAAAHSRLAAEVQPTANSSPWKQTSTTQIAVRSLVRSLLLSPRAAGLLLGPDGADTAGAISGGR